MNCPNCGTPINSVVTTGPATHRVDPCGCRADIETRRAAMKPLVPDGGTNVTAISRLGEAAKQTRLVLDDYDDELDVGTKTDLRCALSEIEIAREQLQSNRDRAEVRE